MADFVRLTFSNYEKYKNYIGNNIYVQFLATQNKEIMDNFIEYFIEKSKKRNTR